MADAPSEFSRPIKTKLFSASVIQPKDEIEERLEKCYNFVMNLVSAEASERENHDVLMLTVAKGNKENEDVCLGMLFAILTESATAAKTYRDLSFVSRDGMQAVVTKISQVTSDKYMMKLLDGPKIQILWLLGEMIKSSIQNLDGPLNSLIRNIAGGELSPGNVWLAENVFKLMKANKSWLEKNPSILQYFVFKFLRVIEDHEGARFKALRQAEVEFVVMIIREKFMECVAIGRDFVRLLQNVYRINEFQKLWKDILHHPQILSPQFTGLPQILSIRTPRKYLTCLVTPDMETKVGYLVLKVKFGSQRRYQDWFFRQYLSNPENQSLIPDLIRFICGVIHPPNEVLCSDVIPRWAVIGWLYTTCHNNMSQANMKLALFYDWLFFKEKKDNIMNIEPAVLLMYNSLKSHASMTFSLLDFICRMSKNYFPQCAALITQGVLNSWKSIVNMKVISSLSPILKNGRMDKELRSLVSETFPSLVNSERQGSICEDTPAGLVSPPLSPTGMSPLFPQSPLQDSPVKSKETVKAILEIVSSDTETDEAVFSDGDEEEKNPPPPPPPPPQEEVPPPFTGKIRTAHQVKEATPPEKQSATSTKLFEPIDEPSSVKPPHLDLQEDDSTVDEGIGSEDIAELEEFQQLDSNLLKDNLVKIKNEVDESTRCEAVEAIMSNVESMGDFDEETATPLCTCLAASISDDLMLPCLPKHVNDKNLELSLQKPQYVIFRTICSASREGTSSRDVSRDNFYTLMNGLHEIDQKFGYHFLFYIYASYKDTEKFSIYEDYVGYFKDRTLKTVITEDLRSCFEYDPKLFMYLIENLLKRFPDAVVGNKDVIHMLTATIHPSELNDLIGKIVIGEVCVIGENQVGSLLSSSLTWTAFEQSCLWRLIGAEDTPVEMLVGVLPKLTSRTLHAETLSNLLLLLKTQSPSLDIIKPVLCMDMEAREDSSTVTSTFSLCLLKSWCGEEARELSHILTQILNKCAATASSQTGKRRIATSSTRLNPTVDQSIVHINELYKHCLAAKEMGLFKYEAFRCALTQAKKIVSEDIRMRCKLLFSEFSELPDRPSRGGSRKPKRVTRGTRHTRKRRHSSESDASEDEDDDEDDAEVNESDDGSDEDEQSPSLKTPTKKRRKPSRALSSDEED